MNNDWNDAGIKPIKAKVYETLHARFEEPTFQYFDGFRWCALANSIENAEVSFKRKNYSHFQNIQWREVQS